ncbi:DUF1800 domain-containing protein [Chitinophagaceae bacterium MMS25-I14]
MNLSEQNKLLYSRAGFGISLRDFAAPRPVKEIVPDLFPTDAPAQLAVIHDEDRAMYNPRIMKMLDEDTRKERQKEMRSHVQDLNVLWTNEMAQTQYPLREKMSLFWHGHFATRTNNAFFDQLLLQDIRNNALGSFSDLLRAVSKSPSMLLFLNNQQNRKQHPNENFAREVMELFTLGRGNYTETDIKEAARAFTGWGYDDQGYFTFRKGQHDTGSKTFLGRTGNFNGDDILNILLEQRQTSIFITQKIYRYFVSDLKIDDKRVQQLARSFYDSNYDIRHLLEEMFTSSWMYTGDVAGAKIKSPAELLAGYMRTLPMTFENDKISVNIQRILGQWLFYPPNVAGWPGGKNWIDSSALVIRMRLPEALFGSKELNLHAKESDMDMMSGRKMAAETGKAQVFRIGKVNADWSAYVNHWKDVPDGQLPGAIASYLFPVTLSAEKISTIGKYVDKDSREELVKSITILLMEMPEYQLC